MTNLLAGSNPVFALAGIGVGEPAAGSAATIEANAARGLTVFLVLNDSEVDCARHGDSHQILAEHRFRVTIILMILGRAGSIAARNPAMEVRIFCIDGENLEPYFDAVVDIYARVFGAPVESRQMFPPMLAHHSTREGFRCCLAEAAGSRQTGGGPIVGFAYGYRSGPGQYWRDQVAAVLKPEEAERRLGDNFELAEFGVLPEYQGRGVGSRLHDAILTDIPYRTAALSTLRFPEDSVALKMYRKRGWQVIRDNFRFTGHRDPYVIMGRDLSH
jgi:ribosomal protein S18 acetylase RimI-like enzyme